MKIWIKLNKDLSIKTYIVLWKKSKTILYVAPCNNKGEYQDNLKKEMKEKELFFDLSSLKEKMKKIENKRHKNMLNYINEIT